MMDFHELTEEFKSWAISELEYREALKAWGFQPWVINTLVLEVNQARFANDKAAKKENVYS